MAQRADLVTDSTCVRVAEVIRDHHEALIRFLRRRLSVADDAQDVAQEAYIRMMKYEGSNEIKSPSAMLYKIAVNVANDHGRAALSRFSSSHSQIDDFEIESDLPSAERDLAGQQDLDLLLDREGRNVFDDGTAEGSATLRHAVGGILSAMRASSLIFAPHRNSYRRLTPNAHVASEVSWGYETRAAAVRIPGGPNAARRIEHRVAGAEILGAALEGIENRIEPPAPMVGAEETLPIDWKQAIESFEGSAAMGRIFAPVLRDAFVGMKKQELQVFSQQISPFEHETYLEIV